MREMLRELYSIAPEDDEGEARSLEPPALNRLETIGVPTLVVVGELDYEHKLRQGALLAERVPGSATGAVAGRRAHDLARAATGLQPRTDSFPGNNGRETGMKKRAIAVVLAALVSSPALAGVVYEIEVTDHSASPPRTNDTQMSTDGKSLKMDITSKSRGKRDTMVFHGGRREMVMIDHDKKSYMVIDEATMEKIGGQMKGMMAQYEEMLKNVPRGPNVPRSKP